MKVFSRENSRNTGGLGILSSWILIGRQNAKSRNVSLQISEIPPGSEQPLHRHEPEQCYYIIKGKGLMMIEGESREVSAGDAVYIPPDAMHGIRNISDVMLEYVTVNSPAFEAEYEDRLWPSDPSGDSRKD